MKPPRSGEQPPLSPADTRTLKARIDCRHLVARDLGPGKKRPHYTLYRCPFHRDGQPSFAVYANGFHCFGCGKTGDAIQWLMDYHNLAFHDACARLDHTHLPAPSQPTTRDTPHPGQPPDAAWQQAIRNIVDLAQTTLWSPQGATARDYLMQRGLRPNTIQNAALGYISGTHSRLIHSHTIYPGILIPWIAAGALWAVKIRRFHRQPKYIQIAGGSSHGLYGADSIDPHQPTLIVEGEFDTLIGQQLVGDCINVVTPGSASSHLAPRWLRLIQPTPRVVICMDRDAAGQKAHQRLTASLPHARVIPIPAGNAKDLTDLYLAYGDNITRQWLLQTILTT
jgi:DNA primase